MNSDLETHFEMVLQARRQELLQRLARTDKDAKTVEQVPAELIEQAASSYSKEMLLSQSVREHA